MLVLSLFPGIGLLDTAFEEVGCSIVRGPDLLWGGDISRFHAPKNTFGAIIGGPPCQAFSQLSHLVKHRYGKVAPDMIPEFARVITEAQPDWWLMENVPNAPTPTINGYITSSTVVNNRWFGAEQQRRRKFVFGISESTYGTKPPKLDFPTTALYHIDTAPTVLANGQIHHNRGRENRLKTTRINVKESLRLQGLPADFLDHAPFTKEGKQKVIGNGVPLPTGRAVAQAVLKFLFSKTELRSQS